MTVEFAYHPVTFLNERDRWGREDFVAVCRALAETGWRGIEYSAEKAMELWPEPSQFRRELTDCGMQPVTLYTPYGVISPGELDRALERARRSFAYLAGAGCSFALLDGGGCRQDGIRTEDVAFLAESANRLAEAAREAGLRGVWHSHYGTVIQHGPELHRFMDLIDPNLVEFCPDTAQLMLGGIDCEDTFGRYVDRITYVHFKDLDSERRMRELGGGLVNFNVLSGILVDAGYSGWITVDLDYTTSMSAEAAAGRSMGKLIELFEEPFRVKGRKT